MAMLPKVEDPALLVGSDTLDDAAVYRLTDELALVQTVDFFTPVVDDPYDFGRIAAANAFSDIYAMGGRPLTALNIVCFPADVLPLEVLGRILQGGAETARLAGATIVGGHTIDDPEPKYGLAVTGLLRPGTELTNAAAAVDDLLVLTKPLGTGIIATAIKRDLASPAAVAAATASMAALNRVAAEVAREQGVRAVTDITGFGLLGHVSEMCRASGVSAELWFDRLPLLPGAAELAAEGVVPGGTKRNLEYVEAVDGVRSRSGAVGEAADRRRADVRRPGAGGSARCARSHGPALVLRGAQAAAVIGKIVPAGDPLLRVRAAEDAGRPRRAQARAQRSQSDGLFLEKGRLGFLSGLEHPETGVHQQTDDLEQSARVRVGSYRSQPSPVAQLAHAGKEHGKSPAVDVRDPLKIEEDDVVPGFDGLGKGHFQRSAGAVVYVSPRLQEREISETGDSHVHAHPPGTGLQSPRLSWKRATLRCYHTTYSGWLDGRGKGVVFPNPGHPGTPQG